MQQRLVELINKLPNDDLFEELLRINDDLNNLFLRYSRWEKNREVGIKHQSASQVLAQAIPPTNTPKPTLETSDSLIDFDDDVTESFNKVGKHLSNVVFMFLHIFSVSRHFTVIFLNSESKFF